MEFALGVVSDQGERNGLLVFFKSSIRERLLRGSKLFRKAGVDMDLSSAAAILLKYISID